MPLFAIYHMECEGEADAKTIVAKDYKSALEVLDPIFRYFEGDCDSWSGVEPRLRHLSPLTGIRPTDIEPGTEPRSVHIDSSPDYFCLYQRRLSR